MSGFLQRLAAQVMGKANAVRPLSRSRYAAPFPPESTADLDQHTHTHAARIQPDREQFHPDQSDEKKREAASHIKPSANSHAENDIQPHIEIPPILLESIVNYPVAESVVASIHESQSSTADLASLDLDLATVSRPSRQTHPVNEKSITEFSAESEQIETNDPIGYSPAMHTTHSVHHARLAESDSIPSLLPLTKPAQAVAWSTPGTMQRGNADRFMQTNHINKEKEEETTEVHVHIGRIEVTAVHAAPQPKRRVQEKPRPMTLDEYLNRRRKES
jgi:hypothetical protein